MANTRILVALGSYGTSNDRYLARVIEEYLSMSFDVDIVVLTNEQKQVNPAVELTVGLPNGNRWSLPFGHKRIFCNRLEDYDVFIYSDDDILITENNVRAFLEASLVLGDNEIAGFFLVERAVEGGTNYPQAHAHFHWDPTSVKRRSEYTLAYFTNEHSASYILTQSHLRKAIASGGFLVPPHKWKYDLLCSAVTDPYTQCGFVKLIPISHLEDFTVEHLPGKYVGRLGITGTELQRQIAALIQIAAGERSPTPLAQTETKLKHCVYSKNYYEPVSNAVLSAIPSECRNVLSIGCGSGAMETVLVESGRRVVAVPLDSVICRTAESNGVEVVCGDLDTARSKLGAARFDCLIFDDILQFFHDPAKALSLFVDLLSENSVVVIKSTNMQCYRRALINFSCVKSITDFGDHKLTGVQFTSVGKVRDWCSRAGLTIKEMIGLTPHKLWSRGILKISFNSLMVSDFILLAQKELIDPKRTIAH